MSDNLTDQVQRLRTSRSDSADDLEALLEVSKLLHATVDRGALLALVVEKAVALTNADRGSVLSIKNGQVQIEIARNKQGDSLDDFRLSRTIVNTVMAQKQAMARSDARDDAALADQTSVRDFGIRMVICAPIMVGVEVVGLIYVDRAEPYRCPERRLRTLHALAEQAGVAWQQARLYHELEAQYQKVKALDQAKLDFIQIASHELRTPLALVQGYATVLTEQAAGIADELGIVCQGLAEGIARLTDVVDLMLNAAEMEQQGLDLHLLAYPLRPLAAQVVEKWRLALAERRLTLTLEVPDRDELVWPVDPTHLQVALSHLVQNAIKFTPDGGAIAVHLSRRDDTAQIEVIDTGIGVNAEHREAIFEKFYRVGDTLHHSTGQTKFMGAGPGLGLFLTRRIVEAHGGRVWVEDNAGGPGSKFIIRLRRAE